MLVEKFGDSIDLSRMADVSAHAAGPAYLEKPDVTLSVSVKHGDPAHVVEHMGKIAGRWMAESRPGLSFETSHVYSGPHPAGTGTLYEVSLRFLAEAS